MPVRGIKALLGDAIGDPSITISKCELYLNVDDPTLYSDRARSAGAKELSPLQVRDWGDEAVYFSDPDSHVIAFARNAP